MVYNNDRNRNYYYFKDVNDLVEYINTHNLKSLPYGWTYSTQDPASTWNGNISFDEAMNRLVNGDKELAEKINDIKIDDEVEHEKMLTKYFNDIVGVIPHVPNVVLGLPQTMINTRRQKIKTKNKILNIVLDSSISCNIEAEEYMKVAKIFLDVIDKLERLGYRCNVYYSSSNFCAARLDYSFSKVYNNWLLKIKSSNEPFNRYKCSFILGHVSMIRRVGFRLIELEKDSEPLKCNYGEVIRQIEVSNNMIETNLKYNSIRDNYNVFRIFDHLYSSKDTIINKILNKD